MKNNNRIVSPILAPSELKSSSPPPLISSGPKHQSKSAPNTPVKARRAVSAPISMLNSNNFDRSHNDNNDIFQNNNNRKNNFNEVFCNVCGVARATIRCLTCFGQTSSEGVTLCQNCASQTCNNHIHTRVSYYVGEKLFCSDNDEHQWREYKSVAKYVYHSNLNNMKKNTTRNNVMLIIRTKIVVAIITKVIIYLSKFLLLVLSTVNIIK